MITNEYIKSERKIEECEVFAIKHGMSKLDGGMTEDQPHSIEWMNKRGFKQYSNSKLRVFLSN